MLDFLQPEPAGPPFSANRMKSHLSDKERELLDRFRRYSKETPLNDIKLAQRLLSIF
jgi:hypothetical protein